MIFLGTGAAEGFPNPFCSCEPCKRALSSNDKRLKRRRSALLFDEHSMIDFGPDVLYACSEYGCSLAALKNVFITHTHDDHLSLWNYIYIGMSITPVQKINMYLSPAAFAWVKKAEEHMLAIAERGSAEYAELETVFTRYTAVPLMPYKEVAIDDMRVMPLLGRHTGFAAGEQAFNYLIEKNEETLLYASDTGTFYEETYTALADKRLTTLVIEGTFGQKRLPAGAGHLDQFALCEVIDRLIAQWTVTDSTRIYITHVAHHSGYTHYDYEAFLQAKYGARAFVAYDGLRI